MDKSKNKFFKYFNGIIRIAKWIRRLIYIILAACMIGFANAYYDEYRWINNTRNFIQQEQVFDDEDKKE
jgi:hypothetical protein